MHTISASVRVFLQPCAPPSRTLWQAVSRHTPDILPAPRQFVADLVAAASQSEAKLPRTPESVSRLASAIGAQQPIVIRGSRIKAVAPAGDAAPGSSGRPRNRIRLGDFMTLTASTPEEAHARMKTALADRPDAIKIFTDGWRYGTASNLTSMNLETIAATRPGARVGDVAADVGLRIETKNSGLALDLLDAVARAIVDGRAAAAYSIMSAGCIMLESAWARMPVRRRPTTVMQRSTKWS